MLKNSKLFTSFLIVIAASLLFYLFDIFYQPESKESQTAETATNSFNYKVESVEFNTYQTPEEETFQYQEKKLEREKERKIKELIVRCEEFGFEGDNNIAACVQREVQVDLALAKQEQRLQKLENRIASANKPSKDKPFLLEVLSILADEAERQDDLEQRIRLYELESEVSSLRSSKNVKQATCSLNRNC